MIETLKKIFGIGSGVDYSQLIKNGAIILDVRTKSEYSGGHMKGSINIAVDQLSNNLYRFKNKAQPLITCCASGMRSSTAKNILKSNGYTHVYNGGSWQSLQQKVN